MIASGDSFKSRFKKTKKDWKGQQGINQTEFLSILKDYKDLFGLEEDQIAGLWGVIGGEEGSPNSKVNNACNNKVELKKVTDLLEMLNEQILGGNEQASSELDDMIEDLETLASRLFKDTQKLQISLTEAEKGKTSSD